MFWSNSWPILFDLSPGGISVSVCHTGTVHCDGLPPSIQVAGHKTPRKIKRIDTFFIKKSAPPPEMRTHPAVTDSDGDEQQAQPGQASLKPEVTKHPPPT